LTNVYIGSSSTPVFKKYKIQPEKDSNCFSIVSKYRSLDLISEDDKICRKWYQGLKFLIKKVISISEVRKKKLKELSNRKEIISDFWKTEILPNWDTYRKFILIRGNSLNIFNNDLFNKRKPAKFTDLIFYKFKKTGVEEKDKQDMVYLWTMGIPDWLRNKLWSLVISNDLGINENLYNFYLKNIEGLRFFLDQVLHTGKLTPEGNNEIESEFEGIPVYENNKMENNYQTITDPLVHEIITDIHKSYKKFENYISANNIVQAQFKEDMFHLLRVFTYYRPDINYSRQIAYIATILYLNSDDYYQAFVILCNFVIPSYLMKFFRREEVFVRMS
jgi:hypothetical protein